MTKPVPTPREGLAAEPSTELGDFRTVLLEAGWLSASDNIRVLPGGVSAITALIENGGTPFVVKAARERLAVAEEWTADPARVLLEGRILGLLDGHLGPLRTPRLLNLDERRNMIAMEAFLPLPRTWKQALLSGINDASVLDGVAAGMAALHSVPAPIEMAGFAATRASFRELRIEPFYLRTAGRVPRHRDALQRLADELADPAQLSFVHGDITPKNVLLLTPPEVALVDFETVHSGDPAFDVGELAAHLCLKALYQPAPRDPAFTRAPADLASAYLRHGGVADLAAAARHTGGVLMARLFGPARIDYLPAPAARLSAERLGARLLAGDLELRAVGVWLDAVDTGAVDE